MDKNNDILQESIDNRIDAFIRGVMTEEEESAFKQEIKANPDLRAQVMATVSLIKGIRTQEVEKERMLIHRDKIGWLIRPAVQGQMIIQNGSSASSADYRESRGHFPVRTFLLWACSVAAVFVIFFAFSKDKRYKELSGIVSPYYTEYSMSNISRGDVDTVTIAHLYTLFNNIKRQRNVTTIIEELEPIYASLDEDFTYNAYANDIAWNLALAYIKNNQIEKAILVLEKLKTDNPESPIAAKASELKKKLQEK